MKYFIVFIALISSSVIAETTCNQANAQFIAGNKEKAVSMFATLAKSGQACGYEGLGEAYLQGWGVEKNLRKSLEAWEKAETIGGSSMSSIKVAYLKRVLSEQ